MIRATIENTLAELNARDGARDGLSVAEQNLRRDCEIALGLTTAKSEAVTQAWNRCRRAVLAGIRGGALVMSIERYYVCFTSSFRGDSAPCISHETIDKVRTLCGRKVADAATFEPDSNNLEPDCISCARALARLRESPSTGAVADEAQLKCEACIRGHNQGSLLRPCGAHGCECWCNR